jgi:transposase
MDQILRLYLEIAAKVESLAMENLALKADNAILKADNEKLKERLGLNSKNSSIPSSKDLYKQKKENRQKGDRKPGGQNGHKGASREKDPSPNKTVKVPLKNTICECGGQIIIGKPHIHQTVEIPEIKPQTTEYQIERGRCRACGKRRGSKLPEGVPNETFGPRAKSIMSALVGFHKNSRREVQSILKNMFGLKLSLGSISNMEKIVSEKVQDNYETIELELSYAEKLHMDETSHYNKGKLGWCWMFSSSMASMIKLEASRGKKVLVNSIFGADDATIITDRYSAYNYFNKDNRQVCWSHLARDFERFAGSSNRDVKAIGEYLKQTASELFALSKALAEEKIDNLRFLRRARVLRKRNYQYLKDMMYLRDAEHASRIAKNMLKSENMMWKFLDDPANIPLTNNQAEQIIRHYVTYRKNSYFTWSERGNRYLERIISLYLTCRQQNKNPYQHLYNLVAA